MSNTYRIVEQRLQRLIRSGQGELLSGGLIGLEKESLRVSPEGHIAHTPHPKALGSALTHPYITTDYSEALAEFITPPMADVGASLEFLCDVQSFVYGELHDELLWATSMPCVVAGEAGIPIAQYGNSNPGMMKTVYRRGLGHRYGRVMQVIAGVHFNYSFTEAFWPAYQELEGDGGPRQAFIDGAYFGLIRNLQRFGWLVPYLFGASPAVCKSFLGGKPTPMQAFDANTYYQPYATSLRMGDIGYQNNQEAETGVKACYDSLDAYVASLACAIATPCPAYEKFGVEVDGRFEQLNANILQIENEYYSTIRPKQITASLEKPIHALKRRGVRYVELRSLDVNAYDPLGISERQCRFLEAFLIFCLLHDSPPISTLERREIDANELAAAHQGRDPQLCLQRHGREVRLTAWAEELLTAMAGVCQVLDDATPGRPYSRALAAQVDKVRDPDLTPSARMLAEMRANGEGFFQFAMRMSLQHRHYYRGRRLDPERQRWFEQLAQESLQQQQALEAANDEPFGQYLQRYFAQTL
jgi:glutamate--cysteine ligase